MKDYLNWWITISFYKKECWFLFDMIANSASFVLLIMRYGFRNYKLTKNFIKTFGECSNTWIKCIIILLCHLFWRSHIPALFIITDLHHSTQSTLVSLKSLHHHQTFFVLQKRFPQKSNISSNNFKQWYYTFTKLFCSVTFNHSVANASGDNIWLVLLLYIEI